MSRLYTLPKDKELNSDVAKLFDEWRTVVNSSSKISTQDKSSFVSDGFYPGYTNQKVRVLFVGRESYQMGGDDYIEEIYPRFLTNDFNGWTLNRYKFFATQFYLAYGFNHGFPEWNSIPWASELAKDMTKPDGTSFAFMNLSKFTNWSEGDWKTNWELVAASIRSGKDDDFLAREASVLSPDVVCTMNIAGGFGDLLGEIKYLPESCEGNDIAIHEIKLRNGRIIPLIDMWHFSAPGKSQSNAYYNPIRKQYGKLLSLFDSLSIVKEDAHANR